MNTIKYQNGSEVCPKCKGAIAYGATMRQSLPVGFGFVGHRFQIDVIKRSGFKGQCLDCDEEIFAVKSQRHVTQYPKLKR